MLSIVADIATLIALVITIWQLIVVKNRLKSVEEETRNRYKETLDLIKVTEALNLIHTVQDDLTLSDGRRLSADSIKVAIIKMQRLNDLLIETQNDELVNKYGRFDHHKLVSSVSSNIVFLRDACQTDPASIDTRFICDNLQHLRDSIKLIEIHLK